MATPECTDWPKGVRSRTFQNQRRGLTRRNFSRSVAA